MTDEPVNPDSPTPQEPAIHPRHLAIVVGVARENRPTGRTEFGGNIILHESAEGFDANLKNIRTAAISLIDRMIDKIKAEGWGAARKGPKAWDNDGTPIEPPASGEDTGDNNGEGQ